MKHDYVAMTSPHRPRKRAKGVDILSLACVVVACILASAIVIMLGMGVLLK